MASEYFYSYFCEEGHEGLSNVAVKIIDKTDID